MRKISYLLQCDKYKEGYVIDNAGVGWEAMPQSENFSHPPLSITNKYLRNTQDIAECLKAHIPHITDDSCYNPHDFFVTHITQISRGDIENWKPIALRIDQTNVTLCYIDSNRKDTYRFAYIDPRCGYSSINIEARRSNGSIAKYHLTVQELSKGNPLVVITEETTLGYRQFRFNSFRISEHFDKYPESNWYPVEVVECE